MNKKLKFKFSILITLLLFSCSTSRFFFNESSNGVYTELQLRSNDTFTEKIYFDVKDSLTHDDFGTALNGTYHYHDDTLFLVYKDVKTDQLMTEIYLAKNKTLHKLAPITYSHHFLNMVFEPGKSTKLRDLQNYDKIVWKEGF